MRLIDADALRRQMYHEAFETETDMQRWDSGCWIRYKMFENAIEEAPTIDLSEQAKRDIATIIENEKDMRVMLAPVKHGKWKVKEAVLHPLSVYGICTECGYVTGFYSFFNYCPKCGAQMERSEE